jgi:ribosomal protein S18 acetylase RimI-like enzyme
VNVRSAVREDVAAVLALWAEARSPSAAPVEAADVERLIESTDGALLIAEHDGRIVGSLIAVSDGWRGNMYRLAVLPTSRRQGIARALVEVAHDRLRQVGVGRVSALVARDDEAATALWRSLGYEPQGYTLRFVRNL